MMVACLFSLVACGPAADDQAATEAEETVTAEEVADEAIEEVIEEAEEASDELADHVCNDDCTSEGCSFKHGEKGHECSEACQGEGEEGHDHDHDHGDEEAASEEG